MRPGALSDAASALLDAAGMIEHIEADGCRLRFSADALRREACRVAVAHALETGEPWRWRHAADICDGLMPAEAVACAQRAVEAMDEMLDERAGALWAYNRDIMLDIIRRGGVSDV